VATGWAVTATSHRQPGPARLDIRVPGQVLDLLDPLRPAAVVHTAHVQQGPGGVGSDRGRQRRGRRGGPGGGARLVHLSTDVVFDGRAGRPYTEDDPVSPLTDYGRATRASRRPR